MVKFPQTRAGMDKVSIRGDCPYSDPQMVHFDNTFALRKRHPHPEVLERVINQGENVWLLRGAQRMGPCVVKATLCSQTPLWQFYCPSSQLGTRQRMFPGIAEATKQHDHSCHAVLCSQAIKPPQDRVREEHQPAASTWYVFPPG